MNLLRRPGAGHDASEPPGRPTEREIEALALAAADALTQDITTVLFHQRFPVDVRHNSKIAREQLAVWAAGQLP